MEVSEHTAGNTASTPGVIPDFLLEITKKAGYVDFPIGFLALSAGPSCLWPKIAKALGQDTGLEQKGWERLSPS